MREKRMMVIKWRRNDDAVPAKKGKLNPHTVVTKNRLARGFGLDMLSWLMRDNGANPCSYSTVLKRLERGGNRTGGGRVVCQ